MVAVMGAVFTALVAVTQLPALFVLARRRRAGLPPSRS
jgi:hypothetical protein